MQTEQFEIWAIVELMGRQRIAGKVSERVIAGTGFLDVHVPETKSNPSFNRFIAPGSVYAINPVDEATARQYAENLQVKPIDSWDIHKFMEKAEQRKLELQANADNDNSRGDVIYESDDDENPFGED
jgi:hypothetical protein